MGLPRQGDLGRSTRRLEKRVYELLVERLPRATLISVAQRPAVAAYHARRWTIAPQDHGPAVLEAA